MLPRIKPAVREQLLARLRKAGGELVGVVDAEAQVLVVGGALQERRRSRFLSSRDGAADEVDFEARLALEVQDLLAPILAPRSAPHARCSA